MKLSINIKGTLMDFNEPKIMGILNTTPDSFSDGGKFASIESSIIQANKMFNEGADIIDVGGYSSRPGADDVSIQEEMDRVMPVIEKIKSELDVVLSIDTFRSSVAKEAVEGGAHIVNDISAGDDDSNMLSTVAKLGIPYIAMHKQGIPKTMQENPQYNDVVIAVFEYLQKKKQECLDAGIIDLIIDPGFGFGKTLDNNFELLYNLRHFKLLNIPLLVGISRKSMIYKTIKTSPESALNGTSFLHAFALKNGANILRVHDVNEAKECVKLWQQLSHR
ncbi:MAG: dihydropteroate synthase [Bacteroidia bacterium]|nr:dihydropteroate synthase [Bacteroidia bacterium]NNJ56106.1 dihydropteroate synthase [Bacteroidia bacterium]